MTAQEWLDWLHSGDRRALAKAITALEDRDPAALEALGRLPRGSGCIAGITGAPGAGKSTLAGRLAREYRYRGQSVGVLAVDPSSELTGGAVLGDRIRMQDLCMDRGVFIRSMASRGAHGGLAPAAADAARLFRETGRDLVLVETVGVGQAEVDVARLADVTLVLLVPGMGDEIQTLKAGIMEIGDIFVVNKADRPGAGQLEEEIRASVEHAVIVRTIASDGTGIPELADAIARLHAHKKEIRR